MNETKPHVDISSACTCGAVRISVKGRIWSMFLCACTACQKISGAGHTAAAMANAEDVTVKGPTTAFVRPADSGATLTRHFCPTCGTSLYAQSSRRSDACLLPVGLFSDQSWFVPRQVIFNRSHVEWDQLPDVARYNTYKEN